MTTTRTHTFTRDDVRRVCASFSADYRIVAEWTGLHSRDFVDETIAQVRTLAEEQYLDEVHLLLTTGSGAIRQAAVYRVSLSASGWTADRPGDLYWDAGAGDQLQLIVFYSKKWFDLSPADRAAFKARYLPGWGTSTFNRDYAGLTGRVDRRYASRGYGMQRTRYS